MSTKNPHAQNGIEASNLGHIVDAGDRVLVDYLNEHHLPATVVSTSLVDDDELVRVALDGHRQALVPTGSIIQQYTAADVVHLGVDQHGLEHRWAPCANVVIHDGQTLDLDDHDANVRTYTHWIANEAGWSTEADN